MHPYESAIAVDNVGFSGISSGWGSGTKKSGCKNFFAVIPQMEEWGPGGFMILSLLALAVSTAGAADLNDDGCVDSFFDANGACVSTTASTTTGLTVGGGANVGAFASIGPDVTLGLGATVASRSTIAGRIGQPGAANIGANSVVGRSASVGADNQIGADVTLARVSATGARLQAGDGAHVGYAADIGDDVTLGANVVVGSLASVGDHAILQAGAVLARGVQVADAADASEQANIAGTLGPDVVIGKEVTIASGARIRKRSQIGDGVTIGQNVRIARDVVVEFDAIIGDNATIRSGAVIGHGATVDAGTTIVRDEVVDPVASIAVINQHTASSGTNQTVYLLEAQTVPSGVDLRDWYQGLCEDAGLRPVMCDYNNWGGAGGAYDARAWNAVILEKGYWSCNVSSGIKTRTGWSGPMTFHNPGADGYGVYSIDGSTVPGAVKSAACTD
jgi:UDP-3-O-[3-hydroxymyristoyl] glucosamine N-acyltransferase